MSDDRYSIDYEAFVRLSSMYNAFRNATFRNTNAMKLVILNMVQRTRDLNPGRFDDNEGFKFLMRFWRSCFEGTNYVPFSYWDRERYSSFRQIAEDYGVENLDKTQKNNEIPKKEFEFSVWLLRNNILTNERLDELLRDETWTTMEDLQNILGYTKEVQRRSALRVPSIVGKRRRILEDEKKDEVGDVIVIPDEEKKEPKEETKEETKEEFVERSIQSIIARVPELSLAISMPQNSDLMTAWYITTRHFHDTDFFPLGEFIEVIGRHLSSRITIDFEFEIRISNGSMMYLRDYFAFSPQRALTFSVNYHSVIPNLMYNDGVCPICMRNRPMMSVLNFAETMDLSTSRENVCLHCFCEECINQMRREDMMECPICRRVWRF